MNYLETPVSRRPAGSRTGAEGEKMAVVSSCAHCCMALNFFIETFPVHGSSGFTYENIAHAEIHFADRCWFIAGERLCGSRTGGLSAAAASGRGGRRNRGHRSATGADGGNGHGFPRSGFYLDWWMLGLARSLGVGTWSLGAPAASGRRLGAAPLRISQWGACLHLRRLEILIVLSLAYPKKRSRLVWMTGCQRPPIALIPF